LCKTRKNVVVGDGSLNAQIMLIGEAPGRHEDLEGRPFVGRAGKILDELLCSIHVKRSDVYIANILKCRPPNNRNPYDLEIKACTSYLDNQITLLKPKIIGALGNFSTTYILEKFGISSDKIGNIHGKVFPASNLFFATNIIPLYHPAAATYNPNMKDILMEDFKTIKKQYTKAVKNCI
jgi:DNA polymerase